MYDVIYFSRGGNTEKVAVAIAEELRVTAHPIHPGMTLPKEADIFLGIRKGQPADKDLEKARQFARSLKNAKSNGFRVDQQLRQPNQIPTSL